MHGILREDGKSLGKRSPVLIYQIQIILFKKTKKYGVRTFAPEENCLLDDCPWIIALGQLPQK